MYKVNDLHYARMYVCMYSVYKVDYRGAAAPKNRDRAWHYIKSRGERNNKTSSKEGK